jgi:hypothetical protein
MECRFLNSSGEILARAPRIGNLYVYNEIVKGQGKTSANNGVTEEELTKHMRLCHLNVESDVKMVECEDCLKVKFTRLPYIDSSAPAVDPGLRLIGDLQGKFPKSMGGKSYSFPVLDDGSGLIISTFLALKSDAFQFRKFIVNHLNNAFPHRKVAFFSK